MNRRIHILGASGSGTTTLGSALSQSLAVRHFDSDDYFWVRTTIPFTEKREIAARVEMLRQDLLSQDEWVLSGSLCDWGDFAIPLFSLVVFLWVAPAVRMERIMAREISRYGIEALSPGGWFHRNHLEFMEYAASYDSGGLDIRSRQLHEQWLGNLSCQVLRIEEALPLPDLTARVITQLKL